MGERHLSIYLDDRVLTEVRAGKHNFFKRLIGALEGAGWRVELLETGIGARLTAPDRAGYALYRMEAPTHDRALTCRRSYVGAFWHVEAQAERWLWPVARSGFDPDTIDAKAAGGFYGACLTRFYPDARPSDTENLAFIPLQGMLMHQRSFQSMSPLRMIEEVLARHDGPVRASLHPRETYCEEERIALQRLTRQFPNFRFQTGGSQDLLRRCHFVATMNSALALDGFFLRKPAILFAKTDFHHIAGSVPRDGIGAAFARLHQPPPVARYLYWLLHLNALNAGRPEFEDRLLSRLRNLGWPI